MKPALRAGAWAGAAIGLAIVPGLPLWIPDLLAAAAPAIAVATLVGATAVLLLRRRWWRPAALLLALGASTGLMTLTAPRAPLARGPMPGSQTISVLVLNARARSLARTLAFLRAHPADVAVVVEAPWDTWRSSPADAGYAWRQISGPRGGGPGVRAVFSRWDGAELETDLPHEAVFAVRLESGEGPIAIVVAHPASPRSLGRWRDGNRRTREAAGLAQRIEAGGVPTLIAGDFNSPPTGRRSRMLGRAGFRRAKPLLSPGGSYPSWAPAWLGIAIDDAALGSACSVRSWALVSAPGTDHRAVRIEIEVARQ